MEYKEFGEKAEITITVKIVVNNRVVLKATAYDIDGAIAELGRAERHNFIENEIRKQYEELPESEQNND